MPIEKQWQYLEVLSPLAIRSKMLLSTLFVEAAMPIYEYQCLACQKSFSKILTLTEADKQTISCPFCKSIEVERRPSTVYVSTSRKSA